MAIRFCAAALLQRAHSCAAPFAQAAVRSEPFMALKLFIDYASQPSRAVLWLCLANRIPHEVHQVRILKGEQLAPEFAAINPLQKGE